MSVNKLGILLFSSFLMFATAPLAPAQQTNQDTTKKQTTTTEKSTATKDTSKTTKTTDKTANPDNQSTVGQSASGQTTTTEKTKSHRTGKTGTKKATEKKNSGLSKDKVRQTQAALKTKGFDPGPIDGIMGPMTMTALRNYQSHNGLEVTGNLSAETENSLMGTAAATNSRSSLEKPQTQPYQSQDFSQTPSTRESLGLSSNLSNIEDIRHVQQALTDLMYNPGDVNGMMSSQTQQAIREFQYLNNLPVTGNIDAQTKIAIDTQWNSGVQNAQLSQQPFSSDFGREKPGMASQQTQAQTSTSTSTSSSSQKDKTYGTTTDRDRSHSNADTTKSSTKADVKEKDKDKYAKEHSSGKSEKEASERISKAAAVLQDLTAASDKKIPNELLERSEAIAVIPNMIKGAFGIGGRFGKGVISQRDANGRWSAPAFIEIGGGSFGAQIGVSSTDLVLVFTDRKGLSMLEGGKDLKLGVDAGVVAGPIGRSAEAGVNAKLESAIYAYSRSKGLFAGVALDGAVLNMDKSMNEKVYGASVDAKQILDGQVAANTTVRPFVDALDKSVPKKHLTQK